MDVEICVSSALPAVQSALVVAGNIRGAPSLEPCMLSLFTDKWEWPTPATLGHALSHTSGRALETSRTYAPE